jgi:hypothetical protein
MTIEKQEYYEILEKMTDQERENILDPICKAVQGKATLYPDIEIEVLANRIFALAVLDLYSKWQLEVYERD